MSKFVEREMMTDELNEYDWAELGRLVKEGNTSGQLYDGLEGKTISWELKLNIRITEEVK